MALITPESKKKGIQVASLESSLKDHIWFFDVLERQKFLL